MTDKRYMPLATGDVAVRMNLIFKVEGLQAVENYFNNVAEKLKGFDVYLALLNCYAHDKSVEKAEALMQKLRIMGCIKSPLAYNIMMYLHYRLGNWKKLDDLMHEMQEMGITYDTFTYTIRLSAYAAASDDVDGVDKIVSTMETDPHIVLHFDAYSIVAHSYLKVGDLDKVLAVVKKMEVLALTTKTKNHTFDSLLKTYAELGRKDDVYRIWTMYKEERAIFNKGYISVMSSLSKLGDIEGVEKIFEEWESRGLKYDFRVPNILISSYCRNAQLEKAEALLRKGTLEGGKPSSTTWYYMAEGYICDNRKVEALTALRNAVSTWTPNYWPSKETLTFLLDFFESAGGDAEKKEKFRSLLKTELIFPGGDHDRLLQTI